jgi:hypothetical protein
MHVSLMCSVVAVERGLPVAVMVVKISNGNFHDAIKCLSYSHIIPLLMKPTLC